MGASAIIGGIGLATTVAGTAYGMASSSGGGAETSRAASEAGWGGSQATNYAVNAGQQLLGEAADTSQNWLRDYGAQAYGHIDDALTSARNYVTPWHTAGSSALNVYGSLLGLPGYETTFSPENYLRKTPGYLWQLGQGQKALDASAASRGMLLSGSQRQASQTFGQNQASTYYDKLMNQLSGLSNTGLTASTTLGNWTNRAAEVQGGYQNDLARALANIEMSTALNQSNLGMRGAEGTTNAYNLQLQGELARIQAEQQNAGNIAGLGGVVGGALTSPGVSSLVNQFSRGSGGGYTPTWDNTLAQFNSSSYGW